MTSKKSIGLPKTWASAAAAEISSAFWPFRFYDMETVQSCEEVVGQDSWEQIQQAVIRNRMECVSNVWNSPIIKQYRMMCGESYPIGTPLSLGRNFFHQLLSKNFEGRFIIYQEISLEPVEIYVAPCHYVRYKPRVDLCIFDPSRKEKFCLNIIEAGPNHHVEDIMHQTMFYTLSGDRCIAFYFVIKATLIGKYQIYLGKIEWPKTMRQMLMICGSDVSRQLGFNHRMHKKYMSATYAYMGEIDVMEDDCPIIPLFLNTIDALSEACSESFSQLTPEMNDIVERRKQEEKHIPMCILGSEHCCNDQFDHF